MGKIWNKFILLMWKNYKQLIRHPIQTTLEILAPLLFGMVLLFLRSLIPLSTYEEINFTPFEPSLPQIASISSEIVWSPENQILETIIDDTVNSLNKKNNFTTITHRAFDNSSHLSSYLTNEVNIFSTLAVVEFRDDFQNIDKNGSQINITLRFPAELRSTSLTKYETWRTQYLFGGNVPGPREHELNNGGLPDYNSEGFLILQQELTFSIIKHLKNTFDQNISGLPTIYMQRFPHKSWTIDKLLTQIRSQITIIFLLAYIYTAINIVKTVTYEKEKQLKEVMKIMGLPNCLHWTVWTIRFLISLSITSILMVVVLQTGWYPKSSSSVFTRTDPNVLLVFLLCFSCASISFCFAISACFSNASAAATFTGMFWFLSYVPFYFMERFYTRYSFLEKLASCFCSNTAMAYGFRLILLYEGAGVDITWNEVLEFNSKELTLGYIMIMLLVDSVVYFLFALYIGSVFPGKFGVPEKWYYPFSYAYWCGVTYTKDHSLPEDYKESEHFEKEPHHLDAGVKIKGLSKKFSKDSKCAVNNLILNMYKDQITVVLGHNGAGKTTTMSMLIGMFPPTTGTALISGCDIRSNIIGVRRSLGLCPQHNVLFDELTVCEHLYFYSRLKGLEEKKAFEEIAKYIPLLELELKADEKASTLSGGMKRKLSVAVAFCGNSEVVILDEPTAGMDPSARRLVWDLLQSEKKGRTVVLTTHFMDEADFLGDRIAIMSNGQLQCCGSSFFLKKKYGAGYHLIIDKSKNCNVESVTMLLGKYIPNVKVSSNVGSELVYLLSEEFSKTFEDMLYDLEERSENLGINTYGISLTTLEEVFMKVGSEKSIPEEEYGNGNLYKLQDFESINDSSYSSDTKLSKDDILLSGWTLWMNQVKAMFLKRFLSIFRNWILLLLQIALPIVFIIFLMIIILKSGGYNELPTLPITLSHYTDTVTLLSNNKNNSYGISYKEVMSKHNYSVVETINTNLNTFILKKMKKHEDVRYRYIIAATIHENQSITGWFNNIAYHSAPLSLQVILNSILHKEVSPEFSIQFINHPLQYSVLNTKLVRLLEGSSDGISLMLNIAFSMAFVSAFYVLFYIKESAKKAKHLQFVSGMNVMPFWIPSFILDILTFAITCICLVLTMAPFQVDGFSTVSELGRLLSLLLAFGFGMLPVMYLSTFFFDNSSTAYTRMTFFNIFCGVAAYLVIQIIKTSDLNLTKISDLMNWIFLIYPHYSVCNGISALAQINTINSLCQAVLERCVGAKIPNLPALTPFYCKVMVCRVEAKCCDIPETYGWVPPGILRNITFLFGIGLISFIILFCIEYKIFGRIKRWVTVRKMPHIRRKSEVIISGDNDNDVVLEAQRVRHLTRNELKYTSIVMHNVTKYYGDIIAVQDLSLIVNPYECFGLLGVNGAGKTTTFKIMTGDINPTSGSAWIYGLRLDTDMKAIQRIIGYCPQFDALLDELTVRETLVIFGLIRGIPKKKMKLVAETLAKDFDFYKYLDKRVKELSGGNKRKLSTSLALVGDPLVVYLDEPTTGMDPATKRYLWNCICKLRDSGKTIVLTSHSMEECEALCTRLAIMVNGRLMCLGSTQYLKNKFSNTYTLTIKIKRSEIHECCTEAVENFVRKNFQDVCIREKHKEMLVFSINGEHQRWSEMFGLMEEAKLHLNIEDYSLGQCSLEQVFLRLTKYQIEESEEY